MRRHARLIVVCLLLLAAFAAYAGWAGYQGSKVGFGWAGLGSAWPFLLAGVLTVAAAIVGFARLAVHSAKRGYDERASLDGPGRGAGHLGPR